VSKHHNQRRLEHLHRVFQAGDHFVAGEIAGDAANKKVATRRVEAKFGSDARIGATQYRGEGVLAPAQRFAFVREVVPKRGALDVTSAASGEMTFCGFGGVLSFAAIAGRPIKPAASADAVSVSALRRVRRSP
jgi:hypothetical protein